MSYRKTTLAALCVSAIALSACSSGQAISPIFAGDAPITSADYVGKTFPIDYIALNSETEQVTRNTGTIRFISETEIEIDVDGINEIVVEVADGEFLGPTIDASTLIFSPAATGVEAFTTDSNYYGIVGFETRVADIPTEDLFFYDTTGGSVLLAADDNVSVVHIGATYLDVNFATGTVSGVLHDSDFGIFSITDGQISGNGITGGISASDAFGVIPITRSDVDGTFYGNDAGVLAGTFEGTAEFEVDVDFVGVFTGIKSAPL